MRVCLQPLAIFKAIFPYSIVELGGLEISVFEEYHIAYFKNDILQTHSTNATRGMIVCSDDIPYQHRRKAVVFDQVYYPQKIRHILRLCIGRGKSYIEISLHRAHGRYTPQEKIIAYHTLPYLERFLPAAYFLAYYECLSEQEKKFALSLATGLSARASALASGLAPSTVREYLLRATIKTNCHDVKPFRWVCQCMLSIPK